MMSADYWRAICPHLHVGDAAAQARLLAASAACCCSDGDAQTARRRLIDEGYASLHPEALQWSTPVMALAEGARCLAAHGWPATALAVYDESWALSRDAAELMRRATGNAPVMDTLGFFVDPRDGYKGFSPHRDRQPEDWMSRGMAEDPKATFRADGTAKYATVWIALTAADSDSSCLHFVPAQHDPGYYAGDMNGPEEEDEEGESQPAVEQDPMKLCFPTKEAYQHIRAVALQPGGASLHTHRTIHWGSSGRQGPEVAPRISMSFSFADPEFEPPYISTKGILPFPDLALRVALVSAQVINYSSLGGTDFGGWKAVAGPLAASTDSAAEQQAAWAERLRLLHSCFQLQAGQFDSSYKAEIVAKYVAASAEAVAAAAAAARGGDAGEDCGGEDRGEDCFVAEPGAKAKNAPKQKAPAKTAAANRGGLSMEAGSDDGDSSDVGDDAFDGVDDYVDSDADTSAAAGGDDGDEQDGSEEESGGFFGGAHATGWDAKEEDDVRQRTSFLKNCFCSFLTDYYRCWTRRWTHCSRRSAKGRARPTRTASRTTLM